MRPAAVVLAAFAALAALPAGAGSSQPAERDGPWQVLSIFQMPARTFDHCVVEAAFAGGLSIAFLQDRGGRMKLIADLPGSPMKAGQTYAAMIAVDQSFRRAVTGKIETPTTFGLSIDQATGAAIARGTALDIDTPKGRLRTKLDGAGAALNELARCAAAGAPKPEARMIVALLDQVVAGPIQVSREVGTAGLGPVEYSWTAGAVAAGARISPIGPGARFVDLVLARIDQLVQRCKGHFAPELEAPVEAEGGIFEKGTGTCRTDGGDQFAALFYYRRENRFIELVFEAPAANRPETTRLSAQAEKVLHSLIQPMREPK